MLRVVLSGFAVILAISTIVLVWGKSITTSIKILSFQSFVLGVVSLILAVRTGIFEMYIVAGVSILIKAILIPYILYITMRKIGIDREAEKFLGREISMLAAIGMVVFGYVITQKSVTILSSLESQYLPISISMLLIGLFIMITHKKAIMQGIGLIVIENGLFLFALSSTYGMPFLVDIGIFLDLFVAVILISILTYRMDQTFKSISTDWLRKLKG
jgi:hydrogenase-4 component E